MTCILAEMIQQKKNRNLVFGINKNLKLGISFIEISIVVLIISLVIAVVIPLLQPREPRERRRTFLEQLNRITLQAQQAALRSGKLHRILFDTQKNEIFIQQLNEKTLDIKSPLSYTLSSDLFDGGTYQFADEFKIVQFVLDDVREAVDGKKLETVWFFATPDGTVQDVQLTLNQEIAENQLEVFNITLNPFTAQFSFDEVSQQA